jgi:hypothetical protein
VADFKIGDRVKIKKLSEEEFEETYVRKHHCQNYYSYEDYVSSYSEYFNKVSMIKCVSDELIQVCDKTWYPEELGKVNTLKIRLQLIKELIK